jgi:predicted metalloendopeptidase
MSASATPNTGASYESLGISRSDLAGNVARAELFEYRRNLMKLDATVDRTAWAMNPQTVNAVNLPLQNALNFPAAYLQPPFYDPDADPAANYGAIGATIGQRESATASTTRGASSMLLAASSTGGHRRTSPIFAPRHKGLGRQNDRYCPFAGACVNGEQTMGENIADVAGVTVAYDGLEVARRARRRHRRPLCRAGCSLSASGSAGARACVRRPFRQQLLTDGHSRRKYRAQTVRNVDAWYKRLQCQTWRQVVSGTGRAGPHLVSRLHEARHSPNCGAIGEPSEARRGPAGRSPALPDTTCDSFGKSLRPFVS